MPDPMQLLNTWLALEALEPQSSPKQEKLIKDEAPRRSDRRSGKAVPKVLLPFDLEAGVMPWQTGAGDRQLLALEPGEAIRWYIPLAFIRLKPSVERMVAYLEDEGPEREKASGVAVLALASFDEEGYALPSKLLLSSFGWAVGEVLAGRLDKLHRYLDFEDDLKRDIGDALVEQDEVGTVIPTSRRGFVRAMGRLQERFHLPADLLERPRVAIRMIGDTEKDPVEIINSLLLDDLYKVRNAGVATNGTGYGPALRSYLGMDRPARRYDVLDDKQALERLLAPERMPLARWPAPKPAKLVTLQQAAVNAAFTELADGGLMAINGPPGTGKTTLLRDVIASVIAKRADILEGFDDPEEAFSPVDLVAEGGKAQILFALDQRLKGHGIVVASSNNAAVRNVSEELPRMKAVAADMALDYFPGTAGALNGDAECWGLVAAVLGNRANRTHFVETAWWGEEWGLERYFASVTRRIGKAQANRPPSKLVEAERPPRTRTEAFERWQRARLDYRTIKATLEHARAERDALHHALKGAAAERRAVEVATAAMAAAEVELMQANETLQQAEVASREMMQRLEDARRILDGTSATRPGFLERLVGGRQQAIWQLRQEQAVEDMRRWMEAHAAASAELNRAKTRAAETTTRYSQAEEALAAAQAVLRHLEMLQNQAPERSGEHLVGPAFWGQDHQAIHTASPWGDDEFTAMRDAMFAAGLRLHRAFIDAAAGPMKSNLGLMMNHLKGKRVPSGAAEHLADLWDSFFLMIPLVSTTFASFGRLTEGLGSETLGWLIVDEAGQATPQAAIGALWRSRRALIIGDPLQIEPVATAPVGLVRSICAIHDARADEWAAPRASVQTLADSASTFMTRLEAGDGVREIGLPLLVHRRCEDPMFSISNSIAYGNLMVHAVKERPSAIANSLSFLGKGSHWVDVQSGSPKWSPAEGEVVLALLRALATAGVQRPNLFIISPFREVADRLRKRIIHSGVLEGLGIQRKGRNWQDWGDSHVGTVHTFQGKEAEAVFLVLGASAEASQGSRTWAGGTPNILNVAATRAKQVFYIIGHHDRWRNAGSFATAAHLLPVSEWASQSAFDIPADMEEPLVDGDMEPVDDEALAQ